MKAIQGVLLAVLVMCCVACRRESDEARGLIADVATSESCGDSRDIIVSAIGQDRVRLNGQREGTVPEVTRMLHKVMIDRAEKVAFVKAEAGVSWGEFVKLVDRVRPEVDVVSIVTPRVEALAQSRHCLAPSSQYLH